MKGNYMKHVIKMGQGSAGLDGVCLLQLDNGKEAVFLNGQYITDSNYFTADAPPLADMARLFARACNQPFRQFNLPVKESEEGGWNVIAEGITQSAQSQPVRQKVTILLSELKTGKAFHFARHQLLSGINSNLWFPLDDERNLFQAVERVMIMNHLAENVVSINKLADYPGGGDWQVTYNMKVTVS